MTVKDVAIKKTDQIDTVHGRLMEAAHIAGYSLERAMSEFKWLLQDDKWKKAGKGFKDVNDFIATLSWKDFKHTIEVRKEVVKLLDKAGASQRSTANLLGVAKTTVQRDSTGPNGPKAKNNNKKSEATRDAVGPNGPPQAWDVDPAKIVGRVEKASKKQEKDDQNKDALYKPIEIRLSGLKVGDFRKLSEDIADESVELIFTDPPYDRASLEFYEDAARIGKRILKHGGSLIAYCGHYLLPDILPRMKTYLRYWWMNACVHSGQNARMERYGVIVGWKPMVWFVKDDRGDRQKFISDIVSGGQEKSVMEWQQAVTEAQYYIENLTSKTGLVVDFFTGGGTTAVAAKNLGRPWLSFEISEEMAAKAQERIDGNGKRPESCGTSEIGDRLV